MNREFPCRCCGLGVALANFTGLQSVFNFSSARLGTNFAIPSVSPQLAFGLVTDANGWQVLHVINLPKLSTGTLVSVQQSTIDRVAYKYDDDRQLVLLQIRLRVFKTGPERWRWDLDYEIPFTDFNDLIATGRLSLNPFLTAANHSGVATDSFFVRGQTVSGQANDAGDLGDIVLAWPPFELDFADHRLLFSMTAENPIVMDPFIESRQAVNLTWAAQQFEFVFDASTQQPEYNVGTETIYRQTFEDTITHGYASDCYNWVRATHRGVVERDPRADREGLFYSPSLNIDFLTASECQNIGTETPVSISNLSMRWGIHGVWWNAFAVDNVVQVTETFSGNPSTSPILNVAQIGFTPVQPSPLGLTESQIGSAIVRVEVTPLE
jgi:hypothetical protein